MAIVPLANWLQIAVVALAIALLGSKTLAADIDWSFADNPHPEFLELRESQQSTFLDTFGKYREFSFSRYCREILRVQYKFYNEHYPAFSQVGDAQTRHKAWKEYVVESRKTSPGCVVTLTSNELENMRNWPTEADLFYCGRFSRLARTEHEAHFVRLVQEMKTYAKLGDTSAYQKLAASVPAGHPIRLNPDVSYFLGKSLGKIRYLEPYADTSHLDPKLSDEKRQFLDEAVERDDFASVLESTPPCQN